MLKSHLPAACVRGMAVLDVDRARRDALRHNLVDRRGHRRAGFAAADHDDAVELAQAIAAVTDAQNITRPRHVGAHGCARVHGPDRRVEHRNDVLSVKRLKRHCSSCGKSRAQ